MKAKTLGNLVRANAVRASEAHHDAAKRWDKRVRSRRLSSPAQSHLDGEGRRKIEFIAYTRGAHEVQILYDHMNHNMYSYVLTCVHMCYSRSMFFVFGCLRSLHKTSGPEIAARARVAEVPDDLRAGIP